MSEVEVAWTAIALLAGILFGTLFYLGNKIESINSRIDALAARLDSRIDALSGQLQAHIERHAS
jgi:hypothetical protein